MELKKLVFGYNTKMIVETKSELDKKKLPDLSKIDMYSKFAKVESKGVTEVCINEAWVTEAKDVTETCIVTESEGDTKETGDVKKLKRLVVGYNTKMIVETKSEPDKKKPPDLDKLEHNVIFIKLPEEEKMGKVSKQLDETGFGANKEKAGEGKEFEKVGTLREKIREERKPPDETVFKTVFEGSEDGKIESKGVTEACFTEAKDDTELQEQHNVIVIKLPEEENMGEVSKQLDETGPSDLSPNGCKWVQMGPNRSK